MKNNSGKPSENLTLQENSKPSQNQKQSTYSSSVPLTPSEIKSLQKERLKGDMISTAYFKKKFGKNQK